MLNFGVKKEAIARLEKANNRYQPLAKSTQQAAVSLYELRKRTSKELIKGAEDYVNVLANSPKEFNKAVSEFRVQIQRFDHTIAQLQAASQKTNKVGGSMAGAGAAAGAGVAALGPTAAMAVATTFGTASTGTAISALGGAAATNAALAWLGGGAVAAGGGGMAAGNAFLALAGPVGWAIGGVAVVGGATFAHVKNGRIAEAANEEATKVEGHIRSLNAAKVEIGRLNNLTNQHARGARKQLKSLRADGPSNYRSFSTEQKQELAGLINNIQSLSQLLNKQVK